MGGTSFCNGRIRNSPAMATDNQDNGQGAPSPERPLGSRDCATRAAKSQSGTESASRRQMPDRRDADAGEVRDFGSNNPRTSPTQGLELAGTARTWYRVGGAPVWRRPPSALRSTTQKGPLRHEEAVHILGQPQTVVSRVPQRRALELRVCVRGNVGVFRMQHTGATCQALR